MPYLVKSLVGTRRDKNSRGRLGVSTRRAYARLKVGPRTLKPGKTISISDAVFGKFQERLEALAKTGIISLRAIGQQTDWVPTEVVGTVTPLIEEETVEVTATEEVAEEVVEETTEETPAPEVTEEASTSAPEPVVEDEPKTESVEEVAAAPAKKPKPTTAKKRATPAQPSAPKPKVSQEKPAAKKRGRPRKAKAEDK